jgi:hypothetical protein
LCIPAAPKNSLERLEVAGVHDEQSRQEPAALAVPWQNWQNLSDVCYRIQPNFGLGWSTTGPKDVGKLTESTT